MLKDKIFISCLSFSLLGIILSVAFFRSPIHDFGNYYFGSKFALQGVNIRDIYEPYQFNLLIRDSPGMHDLKFLYNYAVVPPFTLFCYIPFTFTDVYASKFLFNLFSVFVFCFFLYRLLKQLKIQSSPVLLLPLLLIIPFRNNILFGQTYLLLTGFLMAGFVAEEKKKNMTAAIFYALAIALKISPAIFLFYLLARKNFRVLSMTIIFSAAFFLSAVYFTGWGFMKQFLLDYIPRMSVNEINNPYATTYQSVTVLFRNLFIPDQLLNPSSAFNSVLAFVILSGLSTGIIFFFFARHLLKNKDHFSIFSFTLLSGCLLTAYTSGYSLIFLLPICIEVIRRNHTGMIPVVLLVFLICTIPMNSFQSFPLLFRFPRLYLLLILFFLIVLEQRFARGELKWLLLSATFFIASSYIFSKRSTDKSEYYFDKEISLLSYDFEYRGKEMLLKILDENGPGVKIIPLTDSVTTMLPVNLINNQVYFHTQLTSGNGRKRNPILINDKEIVYLSDQNRGIGFYALRKISLRNP